MPRCGGGDPPAPVRSKSWLVGASIVCVAMAIAENESFVDPYQNVRNWTLPYFCLILAGACYERRGTRYFPRSLQLLGAASYSLYLIHLLMIDSLVQLYLSHPWTGVNGRLPLLLIFVATLLVVVGFCQLVERPLLAFGRRRLATIRAESPVVPFAGVTPG